MRTSAGNQFQGEVVSVETDEMTAVVKVRVPGPVVLTTFIARKSVDDLGIKKGDRARSYREIHLRVDRNAGLDDARDEVPGH